MKITKMSKRFHKRLAETKRYLRKDSDTLRGFDSMLTLLLATVIDMERAFVTLDRRLTAIEVVVARQEEVARQGVPPSR